MKTSVVILCGGRSTRMGGQDKLFTILGNEPLFMHSVRTFAASPIINEIVLVFNCDNVDRAKVELSKHSFRQNIKLVIGGDERYISAKNGLAFVSDEAEIVLVHDGARPLVSVDVIERVWLGTREYGACICAIQSKDTIKERQANTVSKTFRRASLIAAQTPQGFKKDILEKAYTLNNSEITDDAQIVEFAGFPVHIVDGDECNLKITSGNDFILASIIYDERKKINENRFGL